MDTIFALATARGRAGVAIVRISGLAAFDAVMALCGTVAVPGRAVRRITRGDGTVIDECLVLTFAEKHSFTGEAVAELHLHGSPAVVSAVLQMLSSVPGLRAARAGEFTQRALENGRLDLAQVEGLADLIDAETEAQRQQAMRVFSGALGAMADGWRRDLIHAAALIEATIDFADEEVPVDVRPEVSGLLVPMIAQMRAQSDGVRIAERVRDGFEVAIVGAPNVGKSSLLNRLAGRQAAITSEIAGTTRDVIEVRMVLDGLPVTLLDTAGLRLPGDAIEEIGIGLARARAEAADLRIHMVLPGERPELAVREGDLVLSAKADIHPGIGLAMSSVTGAGIEALVGAVAAELSRRVGGAGLAIRERHRLAIEQSLGHLEAALAALPGAIDEADLVAEDLRSAIRAIDALVGRVDVEDILGDVFSRFCIGK